MSDCDKCGKQTCWHGTDCAHKARGRCYFCHCHDDVPEDWCPIGEHESTSYYQDQNGDFICADCAKFCEFGEHFFIGEHAGSCDGCDNSFCEGHDSLEKCTECEGHFCSGGPSWGSCGCWPDGTNFLCNDCGGFTINEPEESEDGDQPKPQRPIWEEYDMTKEEWEDNRKMADDV